MVKRQYKVEGKDGNQPLIWAIRTSLMYINTFIDWGIVFIDSSSSFDDYKNPMFVISTSSSAGGLPLGVVVTSGESSSTINSAMNHLKCRGSFYGKGSPDNIITDNTQAEHDGRRRTWPNAAMYLCIFHCLQSTWRWLLNSSNKIKIQHRYLMQQFRNMVFSKTEEYLNNISN